MQVLIPPHVGYCAGVKRALRIAREARARSARPVYTLGALIHNQKVVDALKKEGIVPVPSADSLQAGDTVIIRSHGVAPDVAAALQEKHLDIIDATCPSVAVIHRKVASYSEQGFHIVILGDPEHPEVRGIAGYAAEYTVFSSAKEVVLPPTDKPIFLVAQTTFDLEKYKKCVKKLQLLAENLAKTVVIFSSICYTTTIRQSEAASTAKISDTVFVIGDQKSSNTLKLFRIASSFCPQTYLISDVSDLQSVTNKKSIAKLGILAGASTPDELIMEVINRMDQENKVDSIIADATQPEAQEVEQPTQETQAQPEKTEEKMTMEQALKRFTPKSYREGMKLKARIVTIDPTGITVAVDGLGKNDSGFIDKSEMELDGSYNPDNYHIDDILDVIIIPKNDSKMKMLNLSKKAFDSLKIQDEAVKKILEGEEFSLVCDSFNKGGLLGKIGTYTIFVPASHIRIGFVKNLEDYVGKKLRLRVLPPEEKAEEVPAQPAEGAEGEATAEVAAPKQRRNNPKRIVASQRVILEEEKKAREDAFWECMQVNNIMKGKVKRFASFGAFVSIMNVDCLAHISDLSWTKIKDPSEVLELNKTYDFVVTKVDREAGKVSLGYKQLQKKPYEIAAEKYPVGSVIKGTVERIKDFGAFVQIEPGIDGLVHVSEIGHNWIKNANEALKVGDEIEAKIIGFENNKITLSMKALIDPPAADTAESGEGSEEKSSRVAKFNKRAEGAEPKEKKEKRARRDKEDDGEPREWVSSTSGGATFADLFKNLDMKQFEDGEDK